MPKLTDFTEGLTQIWDKKKESKDCESKDCVKSWIILYIKLIHNGFRANNILMTVALWSQLTADEAVQDSRTDKVKHTEKTMSGLCGLEAYVRQMNQMNKIECHAIQSTD